LPTWLKYSDCIELSFVNTINFNLINKSPLQLKVIHRVSTNLIKSLSSLVHQPTIFLCPSGSAESNDQSIIAPAGYNEEQDKKIKLFLQTALAENDKMFERWIQGPKLLFLGAFLEQPTG
jgi:hypothetical protein